MSEGFPGGAAPSEEHERLAGNQRIAVLDYGGGNGTLMTGLRQAGFATVETYDPFNQAFAARPRRTFDLVTCFETLEHSADPLALLRDIVSLLNDDGLVVFSTLVQPRNIHELKTSWWYVGPRNGHVSLFSTHALCFAWESVGLKLRSVNENLHLAFRSVPPFARHLFQA